MRFRLEADPGELPGKVAPLLGHLADRLRSYPDAAEVLQKAAVELQQSGHPEHSRYPVVEELTQRFRDAYSRQLTLMTQDLFAVIDRAAEAPGLQKALDPEDPYQAEEEPEDFTARDLGIEWIEIPEDVALLLIDDEALELEKGLSHKYLRRIVNAKPPPKYRYFYNVTGGQGLGHTSEMQQGAAFAFEHEGKKGHYHVQDVQGEQLKVKHDESGHETTLHRDEFGKLLRQHHSEKIQGAIQRAMAQREKAGAAAAAREQKLRAMFPEHAPAEKPAEPKPEVKPEPKPAQPQEGPPDGLPATGPELPRAAMGDLGAGGYDAIEAHGLDAKQLERQAAVMPKERDYAIVPQSRGFALVSRPKAKEGAKEAAGSTTEVYVRSAKGAGVEALPGQWVVMEAKDIIASHDPSSFNQRQDYPEGVQERRYHEIQPEQAKVDRVAKLLEPAYLVNTNPDAVNGAPIVTEDGVVLGGNGRTMGMQRAYQMYPESAAKLKHYLTRQARQFGLSPADVEHMEQPILVRRIQAGKEKEKLTTLGRRMNESLTQGLDPRSEEVAVSRFVTKDVVQSLAHHMTSPDQPINEFLEGPESQPFMAELSKSGILDATNWAKYVDGETGLLNEDGRMRVVRVLAARMLPDAKLLSAMPQGLRGNLASATPYLLMAEEHGWDLRKPLEAAVRADIEMRAKNYPRDAKGRRAYGSQPSLLGSSDVARSGVQEGFPKAMLEIIQDHNGPRKLPAGFKQFALQAHQQAHDYAEQGSMFVVKKLTPEETLVGAFKLKGN